MRTEIKRAMDELVQLKGAAHDEAAASRERLLRELVVEAAAVLESKRLHLPVRNTRCALALNATARLGLGKWVAGMTREVGTDGVCIALDQPFPRGTLLDIEIEVPGWPERLRGAGEVVWSEAKSIGVVFRDNPPNGSPAPRDQLIRLIVEQTDCLERLAKELAAIDEPPPASLRRKEVMLELSDPTLARVSRDLLRAFGFEATLAPQAGMRPALIVADPVPGVPLALVNGGPIAVVRPPVSPAKIFEVIEGALGAASPSPSWAR
jgi:hypothetical protein